MPLYLYLCPECGEKDDVWANIDEMQKACDCGAIMQRLISPTRIQCDIEPYFDENLGDSRKCPNGQWVTSRQDRKRKMKELGLAEIG